jgi:hypothetical protein
MKPMPEGREPRFDLDAEYGHQGEMFVRDVVAGMAEGTIEVKRDRRWVDTGNLYIERQCKRMGEYRPSRIETTAAELWAFVLGDTGCMLVVPTDVLRSEIRHGGHAEETDGSHPTKGSLVSSQRLLARLRIPVTRRGAA